MPHPPSRRGVLSALLLAPLLARGQQPVVPASPLRLPSGVSSASVSGRLTGPGHDVQDHVVRGRGGQILLVKLRTGSTSTHFNVLPPGSEEALFRGELEATTEWEGTLPADGEYRIRVFLNRAAARKGVSSDYTLTVAVR